MKFRFEPAAVFLLCTSACTATLDLGSSADARVDGEPANDTALSDGTASERDVLSLDDADSGAADPCLGRCDANATCSRDGAEPTCRCNAGFGGNGRTCRAVVRDWYVGDDIVVRPASTADEFGHALTLSGDGNTLVVAAILEDSSAGGINSTPNDAAIDSGAVYVFRRSDDTWAFDAHIKASNPGAQDYFGNAVALSYDGKTLAVGAYREDGGATGVNGVADDALSNSGAVYLFVRAAGGWAQEAYVKAQNVSASDGFGSSVTLSGDGTVLAVGAPDSLGFNGAVYTFRRTDSAWTQQAYLRSGNTNAFDRFGSSLAVSIDGNTLAIGSRGESSSSIGVNSVANRDLGGAGAVFVYTMDSTWVREAYIKASNTSASDEFGYTICLSGDGNTLAVGSREDSSTTGIDSIPNEGAGDSGAVYVFARSGVLWAQTAYIKAPNTDAEDGFGVAMSLAGDGHALAIGARWEDSSSSGLDGSFNEAAAYSGAAYLYDRRADGWAFALFVKATPATEQSWFGGAVALSTDGNVLVVGAERASGGAFASGRVHTFARLL